MAGFNPYYYKKRIVHTPIRGARTDDGGMHAIYGTAAVIAPKPVPAQPAASAPKPQPKAALNPDQQKRAEALKSLQFPTHHAVQAYKDLTGEDHPRAKHARGAAPAQAFIPHPPGAAPASRPHSFNKPAPPAPPPPAAPVGKSAGKTVPVNKAPYVSLKKRRAAMDRIQKRVHFWKSGDGRDGRPNRLQAGWLRKHGYRHPLDKYDDTELQKYMESYMATASIIERLNHAVHGSVFKAGWDKPKRDLHSLGQEHHFNAKAHAKGGHVAFVHKDTYDKIKPHLGTHSATALGDHVRVRTGGAKVESVTEAKALRFRSQDGKWRTLHHKGNVQAQSSIPKKFRTRVEAMGAKIQQAGAGLALVFEDLAKAEACFQTLTAEGMRIVKHDIPGVLYVHSVLHEAQGNDPGPEEFGAGAGPVPDQLPGGKGDGKADDAFDAEQLEAGVKVEMEHTDDPAKAREIAKDHLSEDPHYYTKLKKAGLADELEKSESVVDRINAALGENFAQVFDDGTEAEDAAKRRSNGMGGWIVLVIGETYMVLPEDEANDRLEADPAASVHATYYDGDRMGGPESDTDEGLEERHSVASRLKNSAARKGLIKGHLKRAKNNRLVRKATARRGAIYAARRAARTATHNSRKDD